MTHQAPTAAADECPHWTVDRMDLFIKALFATRNVAAAARAAGMSRQAAYRLRARLPGHPFDEAWTAAMAPRTVFRRMTYGHAQGGSQGGTGDDRGSHQVTLRDAG